MSSINYLKLDIRLIKGTLRYYIIIPFICILFFVNKQYIMAMAYLFFILVILAAVPFSIENNEKCDKMYYMMPSKVSSMVLGRFLYLISAMLILWITVGIATMYLCNVNAMSELQVVLICLSGLLSTIFCFFQYPIYYKIDIQKGNIVAQMLYLVPAFIAFSSPSIISEKYLIISLKYIMGNKIILPLLIVVIISIVGFLSYLLSLAICTRKEI